VPPSCAPALEDRLPGLKVLMLTPSYLPRVGGVERHVQYVCRELVACGLQVRVATPRWHTDWSAAEVVEGVQVIRLDRRTWAGQRQLAPLVAWADVVHTHDAYPFLKYYLPFRLLCRQVPVFVTFHGYERYPIPLEAKLLRRAVEWLTRGSICAGAFIPKWYGCRCTHITHGGVDCPPYWAGEKAGAVFVGRLEPDTGFLDYLHALRLLKQQHGLTLPLEVCGEGSLRARGAEVAAASQLEVTFHGLVEDVLPYLCRAQFAFVTGLLGILEAMACGAVVLAVYDNPLKKDYLRLFPGAPYMIIAHSAAALAAELQALLTNPDRQAQLARQAYEFAKSQTWRRVAELYLDLYAGAVES
jgi:glycosyltransferase involved in cell wall biosynthesis